MWFMVSIMIQEFQLWYPWFLGIDVWFSFSYSTHRFWVLMCDLWFQLWYLWVQVLMCDLRVSAMILMDSGYWCVIYGFNYDTRVSAMVPMGSNTNEWLKEFQLCHQWVLGIDVWFMVLAMIPMGSDTHVLLEFQLWYRWVLMCDLWFQLRYPWVLMCDLWFRLWYPWVLDIYMWFLVSAMIPMGSDTHVRLKSYSYDTHEFRYSCVT